MRLLGAVGLGVLRFDVVVDVGEDRAAEFVPPPLQMEMLEVEQVAVLVAVLVFHRSVLP